MEQADAAPIEGQPDRVGHQAQDEPIIPREKKSKKKKAKKKKQSDKANEGGDEKLHLLDLPSEVLLHILVFCHKPELNAVALTCVALHSLSVDDSLWRKKFFATWRKYPRRRQVAPEESERALEKHRPLDLWRNRCMRYSRHETLWRSGSVRVFKFVQEVCMATLDVLDEDEEVINREIMAAAGQLPPPLVADEATTSTEDPQKKKKKEKKKGKEKEKAAINPDDQLRSLVTVDDAGVLKVWTRRLDLVGKVQAHPQRIWWHAIRENNRTCLTGGADGGLNVVNLDTMTVERQLVKAGFPIWVVDFSEEDDVALCGTQNGIVYACEFSTGKEISTLKLGAGVWDIRLLPNSPDRLCLITAQSDPAIQIYSLVSGTKVGTLEGHRKLVFGIYSEGDLVVSGSDDQCIKVWSVSKRECLHTFETEGKVFLVDVFQNILAAAITEPERTYIALYDIRTYTHLHNIELEREGYRVFGLKLAPGIGYACTDDHLYVIYPDLFNTSNDTDTEKVKLKSEKELFAITPSKPSDPRPNRYGFAPRSAAASQQADARDRCLIN